MMEEIDNIIIHSLRQIGCTIDDDLKNLNCFSTDLVIEAVVRCLEVIQPGLGLPLTMPPNLSARFRFASSIAQACQDIGYTGDVGFQTFLYSNESDIRKIFMFLVEKLPKETEKIIVEPAGSAAYLRKAIKEKLKSQLSAAWLPSYCLSNGVRWLDDDTFSQDGTGPYQPFLSENLEASTSHNTPDHLTQAWREYYVKHLPTITHNISSHRKLLPTLISLNSESVFALSHPPSRSCSDASRWVSECISKDIELCPAVKYESFDSVRGSNQLHIASTMTLNRRLESNNVGADSKPKIAPKPKNLDACVEKRRNKDEEIEKVKEETELLRQRYGDLQISIKTLTAKLSRVVEARSTEEHTLSDKQEGCAVKKRTYDLLPEADANVAKLQEMVETSAQKLVSLATQWEKHRAPLLEAYRHAKQQNSNKASESQRQVDAVGNLRERTRELTEERQSKEQQHSQLLADYEKVSKDINRSAYTRRIMEIIGNIRKQKEEIDKVLKDTKELQKEINNLSGQLDRSFTVADELIFKDAKKDEASRKAYKLLATLHSDCSEVVQMVEDTGATIREIRDLEEQIEMETLKNVGANLERISADLKQMKEESAVLTAQIKSKS